MKKIVLICAVMTFVFLFASCMSSKNTNDDEKYTMNASIAYGAVEDNNLDKTKVTYQIFISGAKEDVENIDTQEVLINKDYVDLLLENGPHDAQIKYEDQPYLEINGIFFVDTQGKSKEEIGTMNLFKGVGIVDKDRNEYILEFNNKWDCEHNGQ